MDERKISELPPATSESEVMRTAGKLIAFVLGFSFCFYSQASIFEREEVLTVHSDKTSSAQQSYRSNRTNRLHVVSLNMAHGRGDSFNQMFLSKKRIKSNLNSIADFLKEQNPDVVALQEADGISWWSGGFDHVAFLAENAGYNYFVRGNHVDQFFGQYGTAILSKYPIEEALSYRFKPTPPTLSKGFVLSSIKLPCGTEGNKENCPLVDLYSVHLDFSRQSKRQDQIDQLMAVLEKRQNVNIVMGDFNSVWRGGDKIIGQIIKGGQLKTYFKESLSLGTYGDNRLDWIFVSPELSFISYSVSAEVLSDHQAISAQILIPTAIN